MKSSSILIIIFALTAVVTPGVLSAAENRVSIDLKDSDGDGFSDIFEREYKYDPADPLSHPPLWWRLRVQKIMRVDFPVKFVSLKNSSVPDKKQWLMEIEIADQLTGEKAVRKDVQIGDVLTIRKKRFRVINVEKSGNSAGIVLLPLVASAKKAVALELKIGEVLFDWCPVLLDTGDPKRREYVLLPGQKIVLGIFTAYGKDGEIVLDAAGRRSQVTAYRLVSVDLSNFTALMIETDGQKDKKVKIEVASDGKIMPDRWPVTQKSTILKDNNREQKGL